MAYDKNSGKIIKDSAISVADVKNAVQSSSNDLYKLCNANVNVWAKYKPVRSAYPDFSGAKFSDWNTNWQDVRSKCPHYSNTWWRGEDYSCGLDFKAYTNLATMVSEWTGAWGLKKIRLGTDFARITDLNGYYRFAVKPFSIGFNNGTYMDTGGWTIHPNVHIFISDSSTLDEANLSFADINASLALSGNANSADDYLLSKMYFGAVFKSGVTWYVVTTSATFDVNDTTGGNYGKTQRFITNFSNNGAILLKAGDNDVYPVLCNTRCTTPVSSGFGKVIPLPTPKLKINIQPFAYLFDASVALVNTSNVAVTTLSISKNMYASATLKLSYTMNNKSGAAFSVQIIGTTKLHFSNSMGMMEDVKQESNNFSIPNQSYPVGTKTAYSDAVTINNLYNQSFADGGNGAYAQYIDVQCKLVFADGTTQAAAYSARLNINWQ